jgi:hypothetical protein
MIRIISIGKRMGIVGIKHVVLCRMTNAAVIRILKFGQRKILGQVLVVASILMTLYVPQSVPLKNGKMRVVRLLIMAVLYGEKNVVV